MRTVSDLLSNLDLATNTLHLDVSISSLHLLNEVDAGIRELRDKSEVSSTNILASISRLYLDQKQRDVASFGFRGARCDQVALPLRVFLQAQ